MHILTICDTAKELCQKKFFYVKNLSSQNNFLNVKVVAKPLSFQKRGCS